MPAYSLSSTRSALWMIPCTLEVESPEIPGRFTPSFEVRVGSCVAAILRGLTLEVGRPQWHGPRAGQ